MPEHLRIRVDPEFPGVADGIPISVSLARGPKTGNIYVVVRITGMNDPILHVNVTMDYMKLRDEDSAREDDIKRQKPQGKMKLDGNLLDRVDHEGHTYAYLRGWRGEVGSPFMACEINRRMRCLENGESTVPAKTTTDSDGDWTRHEEKR